MENEVKQEVPNQKDYWEGEHVKLLKDRIGCKVTICCNETLYHTGEIRSANNDWVSIYDQDGQYSIHIRTDYIISVTMIP